MKNTPPKSPDPDQDIATLTRAIMHASELAERAVLRVALAKRFRDAGLWELAEQHLNAAMLEAPDAPLVQRSVGLMQMSRGGFDDGLALYDAGRWSLDEFQSIIRRYPFPTWQGEPLAGKRLLVWAEQGIGDQFMQARVLKRLVAMGADVRVEADPRVFPLLKTMLPDVSWHAQTVKLVPELISGAFDYQISMLSAWRFVDDLHERAQCAVADVQRTASYRDAWKGLPGADKLNVGLSWKSSAKERGVGRSLSLKHLSPLNDTPHMRFHSIQYDPGDPIQNSKAFGGSLFINNALDFRNDLSGLFAHIAALDLVITIDNATAHFAGTLGVPCWVILPRNADWRWGASGTQTPLYPSLRLFRATQAGSFADALQAVYAAALGATATNLKS